MEKVMNKINFQTTPTE